MKYFIAVTVCVLLAGFVLPLRRITESSYTAEPQSVEDGVLRLETDPSYAKENIAFWFDGLVGQSPYRIVVLFEPSDPRTTGFAVESLRIRDNQGQLLVSFPSRASSGAQRGASQNTIFVVGYRDVGLHTERAIVEVDYMVNGTLRSARFDIARTVKRRIVHAGWESLNSV